MKSSDLGLIVRSVVPVFREFIETSLKGVRDELKALADRPEPKDGERGPQGERGVDGANGRDGVDGKDGRDGADGAAGPPGPPGQAGATGEKGDAADVAGMLDQLRPEVRDAIGAAHASFVSELTTTLFSKALAAGLSTAAMPRTTTKTITYGDVGGLQRPIAIEETTAS